MKHFLTRYSLAALLVLAAPPTAEAYSFRDYIESRGGCGASRQVLDIELSRLATDIRRAMYVNAGAAPNLFGAPASEWSDRDISEAVEIYRMCEERIFRRGFNPGTPTPQSEAALQSYRQVTAQKARTIESNLRGIVEAARQTEQTTVAREEAEQRVRVEAVERARREAAQRETLERLRSEQQQKEATAQAERDRAEAIELRRQVEAESKRLAEAKRVASEAEAERRAAEEALAKVRADRQAEEQRAQTERSQRSIVSENLTVEASPVADRKNCTLSLEKFGELETGMSVEKVESLLGCKGTLTGSSNIGVGTAEVYTWVTRAGDGFVSADFFRKRLHTKAQVGLN